jgi:hypothetical protein
LGYAYRPDGRTIWHFGLDKNTESYRVEGILTSTLGQVESNRISGHGWGEN